MGSVVDFYAQGGLWMHPLLVLAVVSLGFVTERVVAVCVRYNLNADAFMTQIERLVMANNIDRAIKLCGAAPTSVLANVLAAGLQRASRSTTEVERGIALARAGLFPKVSRPTAILPRLAGLAACLGTVAGALAASRLAAPNDAVAMAWGQVFHPVAFGWAIATGCMGAYAILAHLARRILDDTDHAVARVVDLLATRAASGLGGDEDP